MKFLGNMTLTTDKLNSALSNGPWHEKAAELNKHNTLLLTRDLLDNYRAGFDESVIVERSARLADIILEIWQPSDYFIADRQVH